MILNKNKRRPWGSLFSRLHSEVLRRVNKHIWSHFVGPKFSLGAILSTKLAHRSQSGVSHSNSQRLSHRQRSNAYGDQRHRNAAVLPQRLQRKNWGRVSWSGFKETRKKAVQNKTSISKQACGIVKENKAARNPISERKFGCRAVVQCWIWHRSVSESLAPGTTLTCSNKVPSIRLNTCEKNPTPKPDFHQ